MLEDKKATKPNNKGEYTSIMWLWAYYNQNLSLWTL